MTARRGQTLAVALLALDMWPDLGGLALTGSGVAPHPPPEGQRWVACVTLRPAWEGSARAPGCTALSGRAVLGPAVGALPSL